MRPAIALAVALLCAQHAHAQASNVSERNSRERWTAMQRCTQLAADGSYRDAKLAGVIAERAFLRQVEVRPTDVDAHVALAGIISQCILPTADVATEAEGVSARAIAHLDHALALDRTNWSARFVLASIAFRTRCFAGRSARAVRELDRLLRDSAAAQGSPRLAHVYEFRGRLHARANQMDSARAVWGAGARRFPNDTLLARLATHGLRLP